MTALGWMPSTRGSNPWTAVGIPPGSLYAGQGKKGSHHSACAGKGPKVPSLPGLQLLAGIQYILAEEKGHSSFEGGMIFFFSNWFLQAHAPVIGLPDPQGRIQRLFPGAQTGAPGCFPHRSGGDCCRHGSVFCFCFMNWISTGKMPGHVRAYRTNFSMRFHDNIVLFSLTYCNYTRLFFIATPGTIIAC
jgi:hypothetical protein